MMQETDVGTTVDQDGGWTFGADTTRGATIRRADTIHRTTTRGADTIRPTIETGLLIVQPGIGGMFDQTAITMAGQSILAVGRKVPPK